MNTVKNVTVTTCQDEIWLHALVIQLWPS